MTMKRPMVITTTTMILNRVETKSLGLTFGTINCNETTMMVYYLESRVSRHHGSRRRVLPGRVLVGAQCLRARTKKGG